MARTRTTPTSSTTIALDTIEHFSLDLAYNADGTVRTDRVRFSYKVVNREADGTVIGAVNESIPFDDWPAGVKTDIKVLFNRVLGHAEAQGYIGAGTDTDDLP